MKDIRSVFNLSQRSAKYSQDRAFYLVWKIIPVPLRSTNLLSTNDWYIRYQMRMRLKKATLVIQKSTILHQNQRLNFILESRARKFAFRANQKLKHSNFTVYKNFCCKIWNYCEVGWKLCKRTQTTS
jgi:hypothetical protein